MTGTKHPWAIVRPAVLVAGLSLFLAGCGGPIRLLDPGAGERLAASRNRPLMFYFRAWDSTQHRNMITSVFNDAAVKAEMRDIVTVELEFAWSEPYRSRYGVQQAQVCVMCRPDGTKVGANKYVNPVPTKESFIEWLKQTKAAAMPEAPAAPPAERPKT